MCTHIDKYKTQEVEQRNTNHKKEFNGNSSKKNIVTELKNSTESFKGRLKQTKKRISELKADHLKLPSHRNKKKKRVKNSNETHLTSSLNQYMH